MRPGTRPTLCVYPHTTLEGLGTSQAIDDSPAATYGFSRHHTQAYTAPEIAAGYSLWLWSQYGRS
jgi:hypothetical protein